MFPAFNELRLINICVIISHSVIDALIELSKDCKEHFRGSLTAQIVSSVAPLKEAAHEQAHKSKNPPVGEWKRGKQGRSHNTYKGQKSWNHDIWSGLKV